MRRMTPTMTMMETEPITAVDRTPNLDCLSTSLGPILLVLSSKIAQRNAMNIARAASKLLCGDSCVESSEYMQQFGLSFDLEKLV